jgi:hypothetical protein
MTQIVRGITVNVPWPTCAHNRYGGYCDPCWQAALARGLTPEEWGYLQWQAAKQPRGSRARTLTRLPAAPKAQPLKDAETIAALIATIGLIASASTCQDHQINGYRLRATDGSRMLLTQDAAPTAGALPESLRHYVTEALPVTVPCSAALQLAVRRVQICADPRSHALTLTSTGDRLTVSAQTGRNGAELQASEWIDVDQPAAAPVALGLDAEFLLPALGVSGCLAFGSSTEVLQEGYTRITEYARITAASGAWMYVVMGLRIVSRRRGNWGKGRSSCAVVQPQM